MKWLFLILGFFASSAFADNNLWIGAGPVRENSSAIIYKAFRVDYLVATHLQLTAGGIFGGDFIPVEGPDAHDYRTRWYGVNFIEVEDHLSGSIGVVRLTHQTYNLTSPYQFCTTFSYHYGRSMISYMHLSNGHTGGRNYGEDMLIFGVTFGVP